MKAYTSRSRFDEKKAYTGVFQQMGRVQLDADWNEEVRIRATDVRRRTADMAHGAPDDGFLITDEVQVDRVVSVAGWAGSGLAPGDMRVIPRVLRLDRYDAVSLPLVVRTEGSVDVLRTLAAPLDLTDVLAPDGKRFAPTEVVISARRVSPPNDPGEGAPALVLRDGSGGEARFVLPELGPEWLTIEIPVASLPGVDLTDVRVWGLDDLPPRAAVWLDGLRVSRPEDHADLVVRGGDGTLAGAGRMLAHGVRAVQSADVHYTRQVDLPRPPALPPLGPGASWLVWLDLTERVVSARLDSTLLEPALEGDDTTVRLHRVQQVRVAAETAPPEALAFGVGKGSLTTAVPADAGFPDRYPPEAVDPCRDRCLSTSTAVMGDGYTGADNVHVRIEILRAEAPALIGWSRDNAATVAPLTVDAQPGDNAVELSSEDAERFHIGDILVIGDDITELQPGDPGHRHELRVVADVDPASGLVTLEKPGFTIGEGPEAVAAGGPLVHPHTLARHAHVRRWDGVDRLVNDVRYNLADGITFRFSDTAHPESGAAYRTGDFWTFTARVHDPDGDGRGVLERLTEAPVHGPVHVAVPLSRVELQAGRRVFTDLRPRFLPLSHVRDRLDELAREDRDTKGPTLTIGDGVLTHGDIDQDLEEGVTADEAIRDALRRMPGGGTLWIRAGDYRLTAPVLVSALSKLRIVGDGDATRLTVVGAGGAFVLDRCGHDGDVEIADLHLVEDPSLAAVIGAEVDDGGDGIATVAEPTPGPGYLPALAAAWKALGKHDKRGINVLLAALQALRSLQLANPGTTLEDLPAAQPHLARVAALPHGVVTLADCSRVTLRGLTVQRVGVHELAAGVLLTGSCDDVTVEGSTIHAASGVVAVPYAGWLGLEDLQVNPRAGAWLGDVEIRGNRLRSVGRAARGVHLYGGLDGVEVIDNEVDDFEIGVEVRDQPLKKRSSRLTIVADNRVRRPGRVGVEIRADRVEVRDVLVEPPARAEGDWAGVRVVGSDVRVLGCRIDLPSAGEALALVAGIVVGSGVEEDERPRTVEGVDVSGCHLDGRGLPGALGVVLGGAEPLLDVSVRGNTFEDLGDSAVRTFGHGARRSGLDVVDNRMRRIAGAGVQAEQDGRPSVLALQPELAGDLAADALTNPRDALEALLDSGRAGPQVLDLALRWAERAHMRGAVVLTGVHDARVRGNRLERVGRSGDPVHTSGVALLGCTDVVVESNDLHEVRAQVVERDPPAEGEGQPRPEVFAHLDALSLVATDEAVGKVDVHAAAVGVRELLLGYALGDDAERMRIGGRVYGAMEALVDQLEKLGGYGARLAGQLAAESDDMAHAQDRDSHTKTANQARATVSDAAAYTARAKATDAWSECHKWDLALVAGADAIAKAAVRLQDGLDVLGEGLPDQRNLVDKALAALLGTPDDEQLALDVAATLSELAAYRDAQAERTKVKAGKGLTGTRATIVSSFAERLHTEAARLEVDAGSANLELLDGLRKQKTALVESLTDANADLARSVEIDWRAVDRADGQVTKDRVDRLRKSLQEARRYADKEPPTDAEEAVALEDTVARSRDAANQTLTGMVAKNLDDQVAKLAIEPEGSRSKSLNVLVGSTSQLRKLVSDDAALSDLAGKAAEALRKARTDTADRTRLLADARAALAGIGRKVRPVIPLPTLPRRPAPREAVERRMAGVAALCLVLPDLPLGDLRGEGLGFVRAHLGYLFDRSRDSSSYRDAMLRVLDSSEKTLLATASGAAVDRAVHALLAQVDRVASLLAPATPIATYEASAVLSHAAVLVADAGVDAPTRLLRTQGWLRERADALATTVAQGLAEPADVNELRAGLAAVLTRLAGGERPRVPEIPPPFFAFDMTPASGVYLAGARGRLDVRGNRIEGATVGVELVEADAEALAETPEDGTLVGAIEGNTWQGCALGALRVELTAPVSLTVAHNRAVACAGVGEVGPDGVGQATMWLSGSGQLVVQGNTLEDNGHGLARAVLHEVAIAWPGEVSVRANTIRHSGGGRGGVGLLVIGEAASRALAYELAAAPFLGIEPPPSPAAEESGGGGDFAGPAISPTLSGVLGKAGLSVGSLVSSGRLRQVVSTQRIAPALLSKPTRVATLDRARLSADFLVRPTPLLPLLPERLRPFPFRPPAPPPPPERRVHIEGNDVVANGPALLLLADDAGDVVSATVVGNTLVSVRPTGAAYLRFVDALVFSGNRCESPAAVNVVVVRLLEAAATLSGNLMLGAEPVVPPQPPSLPRQPEVGGVVLDVPFADGGRVRVPIDPQKLLGSVQVYDDTARKAFVDVWTAQKEQQALASQLGEVKITQVDAAPEAVEFVLTELPVEVNLTDRVYSATEVIDTLKRSTDLRASDIKRVVESAKIATFADPAEEASFRKDLEILHKDTVIAELEAKTQTDEAIDRVQARGVFTRTAVSGETPDSALKEITGLFAGQGYDDAQVAAETRALLDQADGNAVEGLRILKEEVLATGAATPASRAVLDRTGLLHRALAEGVITSTASVAEDELDEAPEPPPDPYAHSMVVLGGLAVASVGNASTAGVLVQGARDSVELDV